MALGEWKMRARGDRLTAAARIASQMAGMVANQPSGERSLAHLRGFDPKSLALVRMWFDKYMEFHDYIGPSRPKTAVVKTYPVPQA
jgi:hypothetical protein